ncbi:MAG TPA: acyl carrier protein [Desulfobacteraceae bacterium]|jgi:acyl carrier protein|nr:MAG: Acyl carrier protein [Bacteroidetes bacterium ADurb.Bin145]HPQ27578.1 acyl carrier protein [Desulfobacteraceae bacterium]
MKEKLVLALAEALEIDASMINTEDKFRDYETYSSLTELSVLAMLDSDFGIEIEMKEFNKYLTVQNLIDLVSNK